MKNKIKISYIIIILLIIVLLLIIACNPTREKTQISLEEIPEEYLFKISDVSCNCIPNTAYFYPNKIYVIKGSDDKTIIETGEYKSDPQLLINELTKNRDDSDDDSLRNYYIELYNGDRYWVRHNNRVIRKFLRGLDITWY